MIRLKSILAGCFFPVVFIAGIKVKTDLPAEELMNRLLYNNINKFLY